MSAPGVVRTGALAAAVLCLPAGAAVTLLALRHDRTVQAAAPAPTLAAGDAAAAKTAAIQAARDILSYDYRTLPRDIARAEADATGQFAQQYAASAARLQAEAKRLRAIVRATPSVAGVEEATPSAVVVLVFVDQATVKQLPGAKNPSTRIDQSRVRLTMTQVDGRWLVAALAAL